MSKILLTGANGFVGSHIAEALVAAKHQVTCIVRKTSNLNWLNGISVSYKYGDLSDEKFLNEAVKDVDAVIHCAGAVRAMNIEGYFKSNVGNTKKLCEAVLKSNPNLKKFVFISTQAAMGPSVSETLRKVNDKENPVSDYGLSKLEAERELKNTLNRKVPFTILRPASVYGPRDKDIFIFFNLVHKHLRPITIKKRLIQLVYVKDVAKAAVLSLENSKTDNNTYYVAEETSYTWSDVGRIIAESMGRRTVPVPLPDFIFKLAGIAVQSFSYITKKAAVLNKQKITEMLQERWTADNSAAKKDLGLEFTKLEIASKITYNWYLSNKYF
ncbi:MAG: NAD-dependent epimerase/dehydratase family protein [Endomicrobia bacterium]|nr:NAD-dependent epimerase/dehydratase family protein [Endomicrobiia bacterium]MCL2798919.1 NAD-dependent epimerase/dehydratase family protein [Endomicrobiia bacterium]